MQGGSGKLSVNSFNQAVLLCFLLAAPSLTAADRVVFSIFARIQFSVPADWLVTASKSDGAKTVFAFQIPNPADEGTADSTNLVIVAYDLKDPAAAAEFKKKASKQDQRAKKKNLADNWVCWSFSEMQGSTVYDVWDCSRTVAECGVYVRMAWPHLQKNPPDHDKRMKAVLADLLASVAASLK
jgi:hypothetical protein